MILPERVFGRPGANCSMSGEAIGPISLRTQATSSLRRSSLGVVPAIKVDIPAGGILLSRDLTPSQFIELDATKLGGIALAAGGPTSHVAILAAAAGVLLRPVSITEIRRTANEGLLMPPKSTFFTPKLRTGLVIRPLDIY